MRSILNRVGPTSILCASIALGAYVQGAQAQPPSPKGAPPAAGSGGGGPGPGPGGPGSGPGGPGPGGPGPGEQSAPSPTFMLRACNKTTDVPVAFVAIASGSGQQFQLQGWTQVPSGQCVSIGSFQRPNIWWYARAPNGVTWGQNSEVQLCVNLNSGFTYTWDGGTRPCAQGETGVPFLKTDIAPTTSTFDLNLN